MAPNLFFLALIWIQKGFNEFMQIDRTLSYAKVILMNTLKYFNYVQNVTFFCLLRFESYYTFFLESTFRSFLKFGNLINISKQRSKYWIFWDTAIEPKLEHFYKNWGPRAHIICPWNGLLQFFRNFAGCWEPQSEQKWKK